MDFITPIDLFKPLTKAEISNLIGLKIRAIRTKQKLTLEQLAFKSEMDYTQLSRIELGKINTSIFQISKISTALNINISELVSEIK